MEFSELAGKTGNQLVASAVIEEIAAALAHILDTHNLHEFTHTEIVFGGKSSVYVFFPDLKGADQENATAFLANPIGVAHELMCRTTESARYPEQPTHERTKGWIIRQATIRKKIVAVAEAAWV